MSVLRILGLGLVGLTTVGCDGLGDDYDVLTVEVVGQQFIAEGVVDGSSPAIMQEAITNNPNVKDLVLKWVPGSANDEANLRVARMVRDAGLTTIIPEGGIVASGGTDLFLAGTERIVGPGACVGIHSWAFSGLLGLVKEGREFPRDAEVHTPYLNYYAEVGIEEAFYWYTLEVADADGMHWMSNAEIERFDMATAPLADIDVDPMRCNEEA